MICPLCGKRKARRSCPALDRQICAVCCGTKRLSEIRCPSDCGYLTASREHPAAAVLRSRQRDVGLLVHQLRDFSERQADLFFALTSAIARHPASELQPLVDADVVDAATALASTFETSARGIIYEHRPASSAAQHLVAALKPVLAKAAGAGGSAFERDAAVVLRRLAEAAREAGEASDSETSGARSPRVYLEFAARMTAGQPEDGAADAAPGVGNGAPRLIVP